MLLLPAWKGMEADGVQENREHSTNMAMGRNAVNELAQGLKSDKWNTRAMRCPSPIIHDAAY